MTFREAKENELPFLIKMMSDDMLGSKREDVSGPINECYQSAFERINLDPNNELIVALHDNQIVGKMQLTYIQYLGRMGAKTCIIAAVRVDSKLRGKGLGSEIIKWGIEQAKSKGCNYVRLTSDKRRTDAIRFYEKLGLKATHEGFKLKLNT